LNGIDYIGDTLGSLALTLPRIIAAFAILPLISSQTMPTLVRNSFFVSLAIVVYPVAAAVPFEGLAHAAWPLVIVKELFIGVFYGFFFSSVFWAIGAAGSLMDTKVGTNFTLLDPFQGQQTSITSDFLTQFSAWLFMASGAFTLFLDMLMTSYRIWPVTHLLPVSPRGEQLVIDEFASQMTLALMLAAPALVAMSLVDICLGLINRYSPQLSVSSLMSPIKAWIAIWIVLLSLGTFVEVVTRRLLQTRGLLRVLRHVL
jgi:type III secretion protein T